MFQISLNTSAQLFARCGARTRPKPHCHPDAGAGNRSTTAVFSLVEGILLKPLPFKNPERLVVMGDHVGEGLNTPVTAREIGLYSSEIKAFDSMGGFADVTYSYQVGMYPRRSRLHALPPGFFTSGS